MFVHSYVCVCVCRPGKNASGWWVTAPMPVCCGGLWVKPSSSSSWASGRWDTSRASLRPRNLSELNSLKHISKLFFHWQKWLHILGKHVSSWQFICGQFGLVCWLQRKKCPQICPHSFVCTCSSCHQICYRSCPHTSPSTCWRGDSRCHCTELSGFRSKMHVLALGLFAGFPALETSFFFLDNRG